MRIYNVYMKDKKIKKNNEIHFRISDKEKELLENISLSFDNVSLSKAIINSLYLTRRYLISKGKYKTLNDVNSNNERKQEILNKLNIIDENELLEIASLDWIGDIYE